MIQLTTKMKSMIVNNLAYIATVDENGNPDVGPKETMRVLDDNHLIYNEMTGRQTMHNIADNGKAIVAVANKQELKGFRFAGPAQLFTSGVYFEQAQAYAQANNLPAAKAAAVITVEKIYVLDPGPHAGELIADNAADQA
ncbi:pyridoxamine 5'-phosphate oxidase family protein [Lactobacillus sp. CC-MHH1034]|uniref:pyridoxamine 5'-phosphate oxidase family protein n=1 Tax=Agrilactobacillus fermenti TaxID=2586909 RepID=UPI001E334E34|nr:pyridoxamine 5'-phosphate oxidase family protein [Agrilactobacillus fermenti]MCD2257455.1 pyridoxamine 5'-phosphate oxidase family protein [Agrilactobacillus fermenti]